MAAHDEAGRCCRLQPVGLEGTQSSTRSACQHEPHAVLCGEPGLFEPHVQQQRDVRAGGAQSIKILEVRVLQAGLTMSQPVKVEERVQRLGVVCCVCHCHCGGVTVFCVSALVRARCCVHSCFGGEEEGWRREVYIHAFLGRFHHLDTGSDTLQLPELGRVVGTRAPHDQD